MTPSIHLNHEICAYISNEKLALLISLRGDIFFDVTDQEETFSILWQISFEKFYV